MKLRRHNLGLTTMVVLGLFVLLPQLGFAYCGECCTAILAPPRCTALDKPLRPYYVPRRPAWGGHDYCYTVKPPMPCCGCNTGCGPAGDCFASGAHYPPQSADGFEPMEFERLGRIPNEGAMGYSSGPAAAPSATAQ